jgi:hypothetical protein
VERNLTWVEAALAVDVEDYQRAKSIVEKISDETLKADAISFVLFRSALVRVRKKEFEKVIELTSQISHAARRAVVRIAMAQNLFSEQNATAEETRLDQQVGLDLLNEVERDLRKEDPSPNVAKILLARVALLGKFDRNQALVALEQSLQSINKLDHFNWKDNAAPKLGIKGSWRSESLADTPRIGFSLRSAIEPLVAAEFDNLLNVSDTLKVREVRGLAQLEIARVFLEKQNAKGVG